MPDARPFLTAKATPQKVRSSATVDQPRRSSAPAVQPMTPGRTPCACGGSCPRCTDLTGVTPDARLAPHDSLEQAARRTAGQLAAGPPAVTSVAHPSGGPLSPELRTSLEAGLGEDLSSVRIHHDTRSARDAAILGAHAYTSGNTIVFGAGRYAPHTREGFQLLAHEVVHVTQQRRLGERHLVQRAAVEYVERVPNTNAEVVAILQKFDQTVTDIDTSLQSQSGPQMTDLNAASARLKALRKDDKIAVWRMITTPPVYATYHNSSGQIRLNFQFPTQALAAGTLVHEAIHAVHAERNPEIAAAYGKGTDSGVPAGKAALLLLFYRWKAWTEYWAYRRANEFSGPQQLKADPRAGHNAAITNDEVKKAIRIVWSNGDATFDPEVWQPTAADKAAAKSFT